MEIEYRGKILLRDSTELDGFVQDFVSILSSEKITYVIVSGYVALLFGRSRISEDVDIIIERLDEHRFESLWKMLGTRFECVNTKNAHEAYSAYLAESCAVRFYRKDVYVPNVEMKFTSTDMDYLVLKGKEAAIADGKRIYISPMEIQIPFKLFLGSEKDIEDAMHLYLLFKDVLDMETLWKFLKRLEQEENFRRYMHGSA